MDPRSRFSLSDMLFATTYVAIACLVLQTEFGWMIAWPAALALSLASEAVVLIFLALGIVGLTAVATFALLWSGSLNTGLILWAGPGTWVSSGSFIFIGLGLIGAVGFVSQRAMRQPHLARFKTICVLIYVAELVLVYTLH